MRITDEQFISAMEQAVKEKGGHHVANPTYSTGGVPECIVGYALWCIDKEACPRNNKTMADRLLPSMGVSQKVANAAFAAQTLNDMRFQWSDVLEGFRYALALPANALSYDTLSYDSLNSQYVALATRDHMHMVVAQRQALKTGRATGGMPIPSATPVVVGKIAGGKITLNFSMAFQESTFTAGFAPALMGLQAVAKKDHDLAA